MGTLGVVNSLRDRTISLASEGSLLKPPISFLVWALL
jgi:hypothetical protein